MKVLRGLALGAVLMLGVTVVGRAQKLDGIAAVVNDDVVLESDVEEQYFLFLQRANVRPDSAQADTLRRQILNQLIDEKLIVLEAKKQGITVSDAEVQKQVDQAVNDARERLGGEAAFQEQLRRENTTLDRLKEKYTAEVRRQLLAQKLVQKQIPRRPVPQAEAEAYFKANPSKFPKMPAEVRLSVIQIPVKADSAAELKGRNAALAARKRVLAGEKFAKVASEVSDDPNSARSGGDLGYFLQGTMEPGLESAAFSLPPGKVSDPLRTPYGWHLLEVMDRDTARTAAGRDSIGRDGKAVLEAHVRHILFRVPVVDADIERARVLANRVRAEAVKGTSFALLVQRYSKYEGPANKEDGDLGFVNMQSLSANIRAGIDSLEIGQISEPLLNAVGFNIFKVTDRKPERNYTLEEIREELPEAVASLKFRDRYDEYVKGLRSKAVVQIR